MALRIAGTSMYKQYSQIRGILPPIQLPVLVAIDLNSFQLSKLTGSPILIMVLGREKILALSRTDLNWQVDETRYHRPSRANSSRS